MNQSDEPNGGLASVLIGMRKLHATLSAMTAIAILASVGVVLNSLLSIWLYQLATRKPAPQYFITDGDGRLAQIMPVTTPIQKTSEVIKFATEAAVCVKNIDAVRARQQIESCRDFFQPETFASYLSDIGRTGIITSIESAGAIQDAQASGAVITSQGQDSQQNMAYSYQVDVPMRIGITTGKGAVAYATIKTRLMVTRVEPQKRPRALWVTSINEITK